MLSRGSISGLAILLGVYGGAIVALLVLHADEIRSNPTLAGAGAILILINNSCQAGSLLIGGGVLAVVAIYGRSESLVLATFMSIALTLHYLSALFVGGPAVLAMCSAVNNTNWCDIGTSPLTVSTAVHVGLWAVVFGVMVAVSLVFYAHGLHQCLGDCRRRGSRAWCQECQADCIIGCCVPCRDECRGCWERTVSVRHRAWELGTMLVEGAQSCRRWAGDAINRSLGR